MGKDKQLAKIRTEEGNLFRIRWKSHTKGVYSLLEKYNGEEWKRLEKEDEGSGQPGEGHTAPKYGMNTEEEMILDKMENKIEEIYGENIEKTVEGAVLRS